MLTNQETETVRKLVYGELKLSIAKLEQALKLLKNYEKNYSKNNNVTERGT